MTKALRMESFFQYQNNLVLSINARVIYGVGTRVKLINAKCFWAYLGNTYMYEFEYSRKYDSKVWQHRLSNYISFTGRLPKANIDITGTFYYQPLFCDWSDHRILSDLDLSNKLSKHLTAFVGVDCFLDSYTPAIDLQYSFNSRFGFRVNF